MEKKLSDVDALIDDLIKYIKDSDRYKRYLIVKDKLNENKEVKDKIKKVKDLQKEIVNLKYRNKDYSKEDKEIDRLLEELEEYPIYLEYNYLVEDLNYELKYIKESIEDEINKIVN